MHSGYLSSLLAPSSIAIVGASERNFYSRNALERLQDCRYAGAIHLVNPKTASVWGKACVERVVDIGSPVEMAFVAVPRTAVMEALEDCAAAGVKGVVLVSNGFGESDDETGRALQHALQRFLARTPMALCGPSCLGVINVHNRFQAFGGHAGTEILPGPIALVSQSGANVHSYVGAALARNLGFSYIVSSGNEAGLDTTEYIDYFLDDANTRVVCVYAESFKVPENLIRVARKSLRMRKPLIVIKIGRSQSSARAALAHTGAMTGSDQYYDTLFRQWGVIRADSIEDAMDRAVIFASSARKWWPVAGRAGIVSISGGFAATFSDLSPRFGIDVPEVDAATTARLSEILPVNVRPQNPIDISTQVQRDRPQAWEQTLNCMGADVSVDFLLVAEALMQSETRLNTLIALRDELDKPVLLASTSPHIDVLDDNLRAWCRAHDLPLLRGVEASQRAIQSALSFTRRGGDESAAAVTTHMPKQPLAAPLDKVLHEVEARAMLHPFGIRGPRERTVLTADAAAQAAALLGGRVAVKIASSAVSHRSELGLVRLDLAANEVYEAASALLRSLPSVAQNNYCIVVQEMVTGVAELLVGVTVTPGQAPLLMVGIGGIFVELLGDRATRICPVDFAEAERMLAELRLYPMLRGYRGRPLADVRAAAQAICAMSEFAMASQAWLVEAEINPLIILPEGKGACAVDALIVANTSA